MFLCDSRWRPARASSIAAPDPMTVYRVVVLIAAAYAALMLALLARPG